MSALPNDYDSDPERFLSSGKYPHDDQTFLVVAGLLTFTIVRFRRRRQDNGNEPAQVYGSNRIEVAWTVIPSSDRPCADHGDRAGGDRHSEQTSSRRRLFKSPSSDTNGGGSSDIRELGIVTANELHVPVSTAQNRL